MASQSWPPPSFPGRWGSGPPALWPCSPLAAVGLGGNCGCRGAPSHQRCSSRCCARKGREATVIGCPGEGWKKGPGPSRRRPSQLPRLRFPRPAHLCCCERASWVLRLPEPGRAGENPSTAPGSGTESCKEQLPEHDTSTKGLAQHSKPHDLAQLECGHEPAG